MANTQPLTVNYAAPRRATSWRRAGLFIALMPVSAGAGGALAILQGWGWDIDRPLRDIQQTAMTVSCPAIAAAFLAAPFALLVNKLRGLRLLFFLLCCAPLAFAAGHALGKAMIILLYA